MLAEVETSCRQAKQETHGRLFAARVVEPITAGRAAEPLSALCERLGIPDEKQAANMTVTVKRRFARALRERVRPWVASDEDVAGEIGDLLEILSRGGAATRPERRMD